MNTVANKILTGAVRRMAMKQDDGHRSAMELSAILHEKPTREMMRDLFEQTYAKLADVPFNPVWHNGTGYFDNAVWDESITSNVRFTDERGRRGVILIHEDRRLVVFERYTQDNLILVTNKNWYMDMDWFFTHMTTLVADYEATEMRAEQLVAMLWMSKYV